MQTLLGFYSFSWHYVHPALPGPKVSSWCCWSVRILSLSPGGTQCSCGRLLLSRTYMGFIFICTFLFLTVPHFYLQYKISFYYVRLLLFYSPKQFCPAPGVRFCNWALVVGLSLVIPSLYTAWWEAAAWSGRSRFHMKIHNAIMWHLALSEEYSSGGSNHYNRYIERKENLDWVIINNVCLRVLKLNIGKHLVYLSKLFYWFKLECSGECEDGTVEWLGKSDGAINITGLIDGAVWDLEVGECTIDLPFLPFLLQGLK